MIYKFIFALLISLASLYVHANARMTSGKVEVCDTISAPEEDAASSSLPMKGFCVKAKNVQNWIVEPVFYKASVDKDEGLNYLIGIKKSQGIYASESHVYSMNGKLLFKVEGEIEFYHHKWAGIKKVRKLEILGINPSMTGDIKSDPLPRMVSLLYSLDVTAEAWLSMLAEVFYADKPFYYSALTKNLKKTEVEWIGPDGESLLKPAVYTSHGTPLFFKNGLVVASTPDDKWGAINKKGEWVIQPKYEKFYWDYFLAGGTDKPTIYRDQFVGYTRDCGFLSCDVTSDYYDPNYKYKYTNTEEVSKIWIVEAIKQGRVFNEHANGTRLSIVGSVLLFLTIWPFAAIRRWIKTDGAIKIFFLSITDSLIYTVLTIAVGALFLICIAGLFGMLLFNSMALSEVLSRE